MRGRIRRDRGLTSWREMGCWRDGLGVSEEGLGRWHSFDVYSGCSSTVRFLRRLLYF